jgi:hypothetical protein
LTAHGDNRHRVVQIAVMSDTLTIERDTKTGRFLTGNRGGARPRGSRVRHSENFLAAFANDFEQHGADVIRRVREDDPSTYLKVASSLLPREAQLDVDINVDVKAEIDHLLAGFRSAGLRINKPIRDMVKRLAGPVTIDADAED